MIKLFKDTFLQIPYQKFQKYIACIHTDKTLKVTTNILISNALIIGQGFLTIHIHRYH